MSNNEYVDHEIRIRLLEEGVKEVKEIRKDMHTQFLWILGTIIGLFCGTFLPLFGRIILHLAKLI
jgi:hypothetical protein